MEKKINTNRFKIKDRKTRCNSIASDLNLQNSYLKLNICEGREWN